MTRFQGPVSQGPECPTVPVFRRRIEGWDVGIGVTFESVNSPTNLSTYIASLEHEVQR